jgi:excisionase family DNA binding protein
MSARRQAAADVEPLWTIEDVAVRLRVSTRTVQRRAAELGARRIGQQLRFRREDVLAYEDRQRQAPTRLVEEREKRRPALKHTTALNPLTNKPWGEY